MTVIESVVLEQTAAPKMAPGVLLEGPVVDAKFLDSYIAFGLMVGGSIAALIWAFTFGIGRVEIWVFVGTFAMSTVGIGFMHRYFVHRSFRCGPVMRTLLAAVATMAVQGSVLKWVSNHRRHHAHSDKPGDVHSPQYDGDGNRHVSFAKGMMYAQGGWVWDQATTDPQYYARDILADPISMFFTRTRWYWYAISAVIIPAAIGYAFGGWRPQLPLRSCHADVIGRCCHDGGAGLGAQMGLQPSPAPCALRQARRCPQPSV